MLFLVSRHGSSIPRSIFFVISLFVCGILASAQEVPADVPPVPEEKVWRLGISERGGILISKVQNLYFSQYTNYLDAEFQVQIANPLWLGLGIGYAASLPSLISDARPLVRSGWDALHATFFAEGITAARDGLVFRLGMNAFFERKANADLFQFYLGTEFGVGKQFQVGDIIFEPNVRAGLNFPRDVSGRTSVTTMLGLRLLY